MAVEEVRCILLDLLLVDEGAVDCAKVRDTPPDVSPVTAAPPLQLQVFSGDVLAIAVLVNVHFPSPQTVFRPIKHRE